MCPFCYIGKRKLEIALASFEKKDAVAIEWHSYQLAPTIQYQPNKDAYTYVAELKGKSREWSVKVHQSVIQMAAEVGLTYNFDQVKITNSFDAHRLIQLAKKYQLTSQLEERFFKAYFTEGALMSDHVILTKLAVEVGLDSSEVQQVLATDVYAIQVWQDTEAAHQIGVNGVPFFLVNRRFGISGAQEPSIFLETLERAMAEMN